ncbi:alpha/beta hydrolase [Nocardia puris]|uniref:Secretory lipase n=1 Tax=Nocardia puris TaxID=208602 RepID=A0A366CZ58_9NOCA|nr:alpha/beta hydrolase [Nocardia puris]MBF6215223.1 alpha/beta hydrolase [Nocardia puris]MBF6369727.1 alpha/beta hydrolase [Nocardia puris]MBF6463393.1 alpha/beta hydrolase [Nocardia puris]RBO82945.1 hypothetical protein DFR74_12135 [Nocardia puris]
MTGRQRSLVALLAVFLLLIGGSACATEQRQERSVAARGEVVSVAPILRMTTDDVTAYLAERTITTPVRNGVDVYRVVYRTVDPFGADTTASGVVVLPRTESPTVRVVSYAHGTIVRKDEAPSADGENDRARAILFAATGYAAVAPDYLGLGEGPGTHPYAHVPTEASASVDLLRAARAVAADEGRALDPGVLVTGFSQGGQAAMALAADLHRDPSSGFTPAAVAAVAGPYAIREVQTPAALDGRITPRTAALYMAYWITAMNRVHHFYDDPAEAFLPPYDGRVEALFDGEHDIVAVATSLPASPQQLLTPAYLDWAREPSGAALRAMAESDAVCEWTPAVPVRLYASQADRSVPAANTEACLRTLGGDRAEAVDLGQVDHGGSVLVALPRILEWFGEIAAPL